MGHFYLLGSRDQKVLEFAFNLNVPDSARLKSGLWVISHTSNLSRYLRSRGVEIGKGKPSS